MFLLPLDTKLIHVCIAFNAPLKLQYLQQYLLTVYQTNISFS